MTSNANNRSVTASASTCLPEAARRAGLTADEVALLGRLMDQNPSASAFVLSQRFKSNTGRSVEPSVVLALMQERPATTPVPPAPVSRPPPKKLAEPKARATNRPRKGPAKVPPPKRSSREPLLGTLKTIRDLPLEAPRAPTARDTNRLIEMLDRVERLLRPLPPQEQRFVLMAAADLLGVLDLTADGHTEGSRDEDRPPV